MDAFSLPVPWWVTGVYVLFVAWTVLNAHYPALFLAVWIAGGFYALLGAIQIAELGAMIPRSGGQYAFSRHAPPDHATHLST